MAEKDPKRVVVFRLRRDVSDDDLKAGLKAVFGPAVGGDEAIVDITVRRNFKGPYAFILFKEVAHAVAAVTLSGRSDFATIANGELTVQPHEPKERTPRPDRPPPASATGAAPPQPPAPPAPPAPPPVPASRTITRAQLWLAVLVAGAALAAAIMLRMSCDYAKDSEARDTANWAVTMASEAKTTAGEAKTLAESVRTDLGTFHTEANQRFDEVMEKLESMDEQPEPQAAAASGTATATAPPLSATQAPIIRAQPVVGSTRASGQTRRTRFDQIEERLDRVEAFDQRADRRLDVVETGLRTHTCEGSHDVRTCQWLVQQLGAVRQ